MQFTIHFPETAQCILKGGQDVDFNAPFLRNSIQEDNSFSVSQKLHVPPEKIFHYMKKFVGDSIHKGDILALKKGMITTQKLVSEYDGVLKEINHTDGTIVISQSKDTKDTVLTTFKGHVVEVERNKVVIKVKSGKEYELKKTSGDFGGPVFYIEHPDQTSVSSQDVNQKIVVTEKLNEYLETKLEAVGVTGFVSLTKMGDNVSVADAQIKTIEDFHKIMKEHFTYCFIDAASSRIIFYND